MERAEAKVCINGSPTCALAFDNSQAEIMGAPGDGWRQITTFMNEARLAVGVQACGVAQASLSAAQDYAAQRVQMHKPIREHPLVAEMLLDMETTVAGLRALWMETAVAYDLVQGFEARLRTLSEVDPERRNIEARKRRIERYLRELTPLVKYYGSEEAIRVARTGMQVFGGYGVVKDYHVERYLRDSLILPIYEGTSQIQSLMATKDLLKQVMRNPRGLLVPGGHSPSLSRVDMDRDWRGCIAGRCVRSARAGLADAGPGSPAGPAARGGGGPRRRPRSTRRRLGYVLLSAERLTQMLANLHIGRLLAQQAQRWPDRRPLAERFLRRAADVCALNARRIIRGDRDVLETIDTWRAAAARWRAARRANGPRRSTPRHCGCSAKRATTPRRCRTSPRRSGSTRAACTTTSAARRTCWCRSSSGRWATLLVDAERIAATPTLSPRAQFARVVGLHVVAVADNLDALTVYLHELRALTGAAGQSRRAAGTLRRAGEPRSSPAGCARASSRPDVGIATLGVIGMCNWVCQWYRPGGRLKPRDRRHFADLVLAGLRRDR